MQMFFCPLVIYLVDWFLETAFYGSRGKNRRRKFFQEESKIQFFSAVGGKKILEFDEKNSQV